METLQFNDFDSAGRAVLAFLRRRLGFDLWMITRKEGDDWILLQTEAHGYGVPVGTVFPWADTFCSEMVKGQRAAYCATYSRYPRLCVAPYRTKGAYKCLRRATAGACQW